MYIFMKRFESYAPLYNGVPSVFFLTKKNKRRN